VYQRGFFERSTAPIPLSDAPEDEQATIRWNWVDEVAYREWWLRDEHGGFEAVADSDGMQRYRPPTAEGTRVVDLVVQAFSTMPTLQRVATELIIVRDLSESETAKLLGLARSTVRRLHTARPSRTTGGSHERRVRPPRAGEPAAIGRSRPTRPGGLDRKENQKRTSVPISESSNELETTAKRRLDSVEQVAADDGHQGRSGPGGLERPPALRSPFRPQPQGA
jgi:hypothetical protein